MKKWDVVARVQAIATVTAMAMATASTTMAMFEDDHERGESPTPGLTLGIPTTKCAA